MKQVKPLIRNEESDFWKDMREAAQLDADKAAEHAAAQARKETLERAEKRAAEEKAYLDSIRDYDKLTFKSKALKKKIVQTNAAIKLLYHQAATKNKELVDYRKELQTQCAHEMVLEKRESYMDEYHYSHDGNYVRKCVECLLEEQSTFKFGTKSYGSNKKFDKLEKSQVVILRRTLDGKEFELEFDDLQ